MMRAEVIQSEINRILEIANQDKSVVRVVLFGSSAQAGQIHEESDIDLCIVQNTALRFYDRLAEWIDRIQPQIGLDLVVYTPAEFSKLCDNNYFVSEQIAHKGIEIYAA
jgi:predicted nucleotidyltransferase